MEITGSHSSKRYKYTCKQYICIFYRVINIQIALQRKYFFSFLEIRWDQEQQEIFTELLVVAGSAYSFNQIIQKQKSFNCQDLQLYTHIFQWSSLLLFSF